MHQSIKNLNLIKEELKFNDNKIPSIIAVSKTFSTSDILPLVNEGHIHFGENKVQEALSKWIEIKKKYEQIKLHMIGKLQTNKVKFTLPLFDFIHSLDNQKLAEKISLEQKKHLKKPKIFIQVNIGDESQKSGISKKDLKNFYEKCKNLDLNIIGLMCIPPVDEDPGIYFKEMKNLSNELNLQELSMGMSEDYMIAAKNFSTFLRIGTKIFGKRG